VAETRLLDDEDEEDEEDEGSMAREMINISIPVRQ
jgi:hypothetical protein